MMSVQTATSDPIDRVRAALPEALRHPTVTTLLRRCVAEDVAPAGAWAPTDGTPTRGDVTSMATVPPDAQLTGRLVAKESGVVAGLPLADALCCFVDANLSFAAATSDGDHVAAGDVIATVEGPGRSLLTAERPAVNLVGHLSGIATLTYRFVDAVRHTGAAVLDTRKTLPGLRHPQKYAVRQGGGKNHRLGLFDMVLIKENHIDAAGGVSAALQRVREAHGKEYPVEIEVTSLSELEAALPHAPDIVLLDNMDIPTLREAVAYAGDTTLLEASGGITLDTVADVAETGVDRISVGALTHSASALDLSLRVD